MRYTAFNGELKVDSRAAICLNPHVAVEGVVTKLVNNEATVETPGGTKFTVQGGYMGFKAGAHVHFDCITVF